MANAVTKKDQTNLPAALMADMEADAAQHGQAFDADMLIIPRLKILQDLSPEVKPEKAEYREGARPGLIFNEVNRALDEEIVFTPSLFMVRYIAWRPRKAGGGLVDPNLTKDMVEENFEQDGIGSWTGLMRPPGQEDAVRVEVHQTPEYVGIAKGKGWGPMPVALSMPSTKVKSARKINTAIDLTELPGKGGKSFRPPMFYHQFKLRTGLEQSGEQTWFGFVIDHLGVPHPNNERASEIDVDMIERAKALKIRFDEGTAAVDDSTLEK